VIPCVASRLVVLIADEPLVSARATVGGSTVGGSVEAACREERWRGSV
jgi:hypothetical protein